jgi:hypothetical protein
MADNERASFGFYPQLRRNRTVQDPEAAKNAPLAALRGFVAGVAGAPGDLESLAYMPYDYLRAPKMSELVTGEKKTKTFFPTSEEIEKRIPFRGESPVEKAFAGAGQLAGGFYYGAGSPLKVLAESPQILKKAGTDFARSIAPVNVIKPLDGNWVVEPKMNNLYSRAGYKPDLQETLAELQARYTPEVMANLDPNVRDHVSRSIKETTDAVAMDKWLDSNMKNYVKNEMGTVNDPIRLSIEKREAEILAKFEKDQQRAQRMAGRAEAEPDPRRKANMTRQADQMLEQAEADKALALQHTSHLPPEMQNFEIMWTPEDLASARKAEGFPEEGIGKSKASQLWEQMADESIYPTKARDIQEYPAKMQKRSEAYAKLADFEAKVDQKLRDKFITAGVDESVLNKYLENTLITEKAEVVGEGAKGRKLFNSVGPLPSNQHFLEHASNTNPWISKLDPNTSVYSGDVSGLHFDHVIDVIKEDLATGRLRPEKLNTLSIEQAVRRTADYDLDMAKKMSSERASARANLPVYKEYPDEGLKWIQLNRPSDFAAESDAMGHSARGYEPPVGHPDWVEGSGDTGRSSYGLGGWEAIKSGDAKVYSLVDSKGEPHVTIEVGKGKHPIGTTGRGNNFPDELHYGEYNDDHSIISKEKKLEIYNLGKKLYGEKGGDLHDRFQEAADQLLGELPGVVHQIKGKSNARPIEKYDPYTQDFVKSNNWTEVRDLDNTGLIEQHSLDRKIAKDVLGLDLPRYVTKQEAKDYMVLDVNRHHKGAKDLEIPESLLKYKIQPDIPPPVEGMKRGGAVTLEDLAMNYYVPDYNEDDYYEMPMALMPPQQRMNKGGLTQYKECNCHG